jgi:hypothetical protein
LECELTNDFVFVPDGLSYFTSEASIAPVSNVEETLPIHTVLVAGMNNSLSVYTVGGRLKFQHLGKLAGYVKDKMESVISRTFYSIFSSFTLSSPTPSAPEIEEKSLTSQLDFEDSNRRILRLSIDPSGKLIATADSLGRVMLYDTRLNAMIRLWKGVRDARLGWSEDSQHVVSSYKNQSSEGQLKWSRPKLVLAIYAPQIGLLFMYSMRHGPLLRTVPVGQNAQMFSLPYLNEFGER